MYLRVFEVAQATGKTEGYVRQHINRGHLESKLVDNDRVVELEAMLRWAEARKLTVDPEAFGGLPSTSTPVQTPRIARVAILALVENGQRKNLLTTVRHRRADQLGPWAKPCSKPWHHESLNDGLELFTADFLGDDWRDVLREMLDGKLAIDNQADSKKILYQLNPEPRRHWAYRDLTVEAGTHIHSPFSGCSAELTEYWGVDDSLPEHWKTLREKIPGEQLRSLTFDLHRFSDRAGNVLIFAALDEVRCNVSPHQDNSVCLTVESDTPIIPGSYTAILRAYQGDDVVLERSATVHGRETIIPVDADIDRVGHVLYREKDGQCIDYSDTLLMKEIGGNIAVQVAELTHRNKKGEKHSVRLTMNAPFGATLPDRSLLDKRIRSRRLARLLDVREQAARRANKLIRYKPEKFEDAIKQLAKILHESPDKVEPIYLADPYFHEGNQEIEFGYVDLLNASRGRPLRILCCVEDPKDLKWWEGFRKRISSELLKHVEIRSVCRPPNPTQKPRKPKTCPSCQAQLPAKPEGPKAGFHDRFLITPHSEVLISNSFNNWANHGVTFTSLPFGVYRAEAEILWDPPPGISPDYIVERIAL